MSNNNQITAGGMAQLSGLEIFASNTVYGDETVGFGNPLFSSNIDSATDVATEEADAPLNAVETTFTAGFTSNIWYKYHTAGTVYTPIDAPDISIPKVIWANRWRGVFYQYSCASWNCCWYY